MTVIIWPVKPKIFIFWLFTEEVCGPAALSPCASYLPCSLRIPCSSRNRVVLHIYLSNEFNEQGNTEHCDWLWLWACMSFEPIFLTGKRELIRATRMCMSMSIFACLGMRSQWQKGYYAGFASIQRSSFRTWFRHLLSLWLWGKKKINLLCFGLFKKESDPHLSQF